MTERDKAILRDRVARARLEKLGATEARRYPSRQSITCSVCGCHHDNMTLGCRQCASRHSHRRTRGMTNALPCRTKRGQPKPPVRKTCAGCGCPLTEHSTPGCRRCNERRSYRSVLHQGSSHTAGSRRLDGASLPVTNPDGAHLQREAA